MRSGALTLTAVLSFAVLVNATGASAQIRGPVGRSRSELALRSHAASAAGIQLRLGEGKLAAARRFARAARQATSVQSLARTARLLPYLRAARRTEFTGESLRRALARPGQVARSFQLNVRSGGRNRKALIRLPDNYDPSKPTRVVLNFHGYALGANLTAEHTRMEHAGAERDAIVIHPQSATLDRSWNAGPCCGLAQFQGVDDVQYVRDLLAELDASFNVDRSRTDLVGFSNGGFMARRLAVEIPDRFASLVQVASHDIVDLSGDGAAELIAAQPPGRSILSIRGMFDPIVPGTVRSLNHRVLRWPAGEQESLLNWIRVNQASDTPFSEQQTEDEVIREWRAPNGARYVLRLLLNATHTWPGDGMIPGAGDPEILQRESGDMLDWLESERQRPTQRARAAE